jgi:hypothetical protein
MFECMSGCCATRFLGRLMILCCDVMSVGVACAHLDIVAVVVGFVTADCWAACVLSERAHLHRGVLRCPEMEMEFILKLLLLIGCCRRLGEFHRFYTPLLDTYGISADG